MFNTLRPRQDDHNFAYHFQMHFFFQTTKTSLQCVRGGAVDYKMKIGSGNGLAPSRHQVITWVSGDPGQWCIYASLGLIELITSPYWEIYRCGEKTVLFEHTRDTFIPIAESGQFRPVRSGRVGGQVDHDL